MEHIFEFSFSSDGLERQTAYLEGTWLDAIEYHSELIRRGYEGITMRVKK